jgi:general stress protein 26
MSLEAEAEKEVAERIKPEVLSFIQDRSGKSMAYLITLRKDGRPHARPVSTFVEGWTVGTISQGEHLKNQHIRNNPQVGYLWVEMFPAEGQRPKSVWLQGNCEIVEDSKEVQDFFARRQAATGVGDRHPDEEWTRLLLRTRPTLVRAEGFLGPLKPALYREFD